MTKFNETIKDMIDNSDQTHKLIGLLADLFETRVQSIDDNMQVIKGVLLKLETKMYDHDKACPFQSLEKIKKVDMDLNIKLDELESRIDIQLKEINDTIDFIKFFKKYKWIAVIAGIGLITLIAIYGLPALITLI